MKIGLATAIRSAGVPETAAVPGECNGRRLTVAILGALRSFAIKNGELRRQLEPHIAA
jgi:hypothetical protein